MPRERLFLRPKDFYDDQNSALRLGVDVTEITPAERTVACGGDVIPYDQLILSTGATPRRLPSSLGGNLPGPYTIRGIADIDAIAPEFKAGRRLECNPISVNR